MGRRAVSLTAPLWLLFIVPGWIAWGVISIWFLYRVVRGWMCLNDNTPMPMPDMEAAMTSARPELHLLQDRGRPDPGRKVYEDDELFVFHDIAPWAPVHFS